jgi:hypothetical protein
VSQVDQVQTGTYIRLAAPITVFTPGSIAANSETPITQTGCDINVGETGICFVGTPATNAIKFGHVTCTTQGSAIISLVNPTAGALTPTAASATAPYIMLLWGSK